jgi:hypothetical protein
LIDVALAPVVEGGDDEQREADGGDEGEADERIEQRETGAWRVFAGARGVGRGLLGVGLRWRGFWVGNGVAPWQAELLVFEGFDGV